MGNHRSKFFLKKIKDLTQCLNNPLCMDSIKNTPVIFSYVLSKNDKILKIHKQTTFSIVEFQNIYEQLVDIKSRGGRYHILKIEYINFEKLNKNRKQIDELNNLIRWG